MKILISAVFLVTSSFVSGQRPSFAGFRPIGFPDTPNRTTTTPDPLGNRFGDGTPERLPIEANGDRDLIDRLSKLPIDKQPFWFINWQAYEKHRKEPQTFPQRPNAFVDPIPNSNFGQANSGFSTPGSVLIGPETTAVFNRFGPTTTSRTIQLSSNFNNNDNFNTPGNNYPSGSVYPNNNPNFNGNNANYVVYPTTSPNFNVNPTANPNFNAYPNRNSNSNNYPTGNTNNYPTGNFNNYPNGNFNNYPTGSSNNYPTGSSNNYSSGSSNPSGNSNSFQSSNFNTQTNSGTTTKNGVTYFQTTQKYQWNTTYKTTNVGPTTFNQYPEYYPRTDTYQPRFGRRF